MIFALIGGGKSKWMYRIFERFEVEILFDCRNMINLKRFSNGIRPFARNSFSVLYRKDKLNNAQLFI